MTAEEVDQPVERALMSAAYFRGGDLSDRVWGSNSDQIVTLSLYFTGELSAGECAARFAKRSYVQQLYRKDGELSEVVALRYRALIDLLRRRPDLIEGGGDFTTPADPTFTSCRLTETGLMMARMQMKEFPPKPSFPNWPDRRTLPAW